MKIKPAALLLTLAATLTGHCLALTPIAEDFNAAKLNKERWMQYKTGASKFTQANGKLNFLVTGTPTNSDYVTLSLMESRPGIAENWDMILDVSNSLKHKQGTQASCGFQISNDQQYDDYLYVNFFGTGGIDAGAYNKGVFIPSKRLTFDQGVVKGAMRVSYRKATKLMTFYASLTQKDKGYQWIKIGTFAPVGAEKADVKGNWDMNKTTGLFAIQLTGFGIKQAVSQGQINIDNFSLQKP